MDANIEHVKVQLSAMQESFIGNCLYRVFYGSGQGHDLLNMAPNKEGYPHNGGEHTLRISGEKEEVIAFIELFEDYTATNLSAIKDAVNKGKKGIKAMSLLPELFRTPHYRK